MEDSNKELEPRSMGSESMSIDLWDKSEPRSLVNISTPVVAEALVRGAQEKPDLFGLDERTLFQTMKREGWMPTATDNRLRIAFWQEYDRAQANSRQMHMLSVFDGVCSKDYFYGRYLKNSWKVAWLACPPASYEVIAAEALVFGLEQLRDILSLPIQDAKGRVNTKLGELQAKIVAMLDTRVRGAITQKHELKSLQLQVQTKDTAVAKMAMAGSMDDLEKRLKELEARERRSQNLVQMMSGVDGTESKDTGRSEGAIEGEFVSISETEG